MLGPARGDGEAWSSLRAKFVLTAGRTVLVADGGSNGVGTPEHSNLSETSSRRKRGAAGCFGCWLLTRARDGRDWFAYPQPGGRGTKSKTKAVRLHERVGTWDVIGVPAFRVHERVADSSTLGRYCACPWHHPHAACTQLVTIPPPDSGERCMYIIHPRH